MGEAKHKQSATRKFIAEFPQCAFCGGNRPSKTREHMPPKSLFDRSHRPDKLVMPACDECNRGTSTADLVAAIVSRWNYNSGHVEQEDHAKLVRQVRTHHPDIFAEWSKEMNLSERLEAVSHLGNYGIDVPEDAGLITFGQATIRQLNLFSHKAVLALYFEHFKSVLLDHGRVAAYWRTKEDFHGGAPPELLNLMQRYGTLEQGRWNTNEIFEYRFEVDEKEGLFICLARLRGGLYVSGFAVSDALILEKRGANEFGWIQPLRSTCNARYARVCRKAVISGMLWRAFPHGVAKA
jgi:hypothetical protein